MDVAILFNSVFTCFQFLAWPLLSMVYPLYASIEATERNSISDTQKLITYWICFAAILLFEYFASVLLEWLPFWAYVKLSIICCLVAPHFDGSLYMYKRFISPVHFEIRNWYKNMKKRFCLRVSLILLEAKNYFVQIEADQASPSSKELKIKNIIADILLDNNKIEDKNPCERIENEGVGSTEQVKEIMTDISLHEVEDQDFQDSSSIGKVLKEWTCEVCEVKASSESDLESHLHGKQHKVASEVLKSKSGSTTLEQGTCSICQTVITARKDTIQHKTNCELLKTHQPHGYATSIAHWTVPCNSSLHEQGTAKSCTTNDCSGETKAVQASKGSEKVKQPNMAYQTELNAAVEQTEEVRVHPTVVGVSLESNEIKDEKDSSVGYQIQSNKAAAVEQIENERAAPTKQVTEITTDVSLDEVEERESQYSSSFVNIQKEWNSQDSSRFEKIKKEWTCEVCEVKTNSESDLQSHLKGKLHKEVRKIVNPKSQSTTGLQWTCSICQTVIPTRKDIIQHLRGTRHNANLELLKTDQLIIVIPHGYAVGNTSNVLEKQKEGAVKSRPDEMKNYHWWCTICNISCSSKGNMASHLNGGKHLAKIQEIKNYHWWCTLCNISCSSKGNMDSHLNGSKHLAKIQEMKNYHWWCPLCDISCSSKGNIDSHLNGSKHLAKIQEMKNYLWWCTLCDISCSSKGNMDSHLNGTKHLAKIQELNGEASNS